MNSIWVHFLLKTTTVTFLYSNIALPIVMNKFIDYNKNI